jgi:iron complex transport system substrate-binding protein
MRWALPFLILTLLLPLSGCADKPARLARRPKIYRKIISLSPGTSEIVASDADATTLKGRTAACNFPQNMMASIPIVASIKPDYEKIQSLKPDMILYDKGLYSDQDIDKLKSAHAEMFPIDAETVDAFIKELYILGSKLGYETRMNDYVERIQQERATNESLPLNPKPKVAIVMPSPDGNDMICGVKGFLGDVVKCSGGELVGPPTDKFEALNAEAFVGMNPDIIVVGASKFNLTVDQLLLDDQRFKTITAIKNKQVRLLDGDVLYRRGSRVDSLLKAMHQVLSPPK